MFLLDIISGKNIENVVWKTDKIQKFCCKTIDYVWCIAIVITQGIIDLCASSNWECSFPIKVRYDEIYVSIITQIVYTAPKWLTSFVLPHV